MKKNKKRKKDQSAWHVAVNHQGGESAAESKVRALRNTYPEGDAGKGLEIKEFCVSYHVTRDTFSRLTGFSPRAVANWTEGRKPSESTARRLTEVKRIFVVLERLAARESLGRWLKEPNSAFDGSTPLQVIERGESDRIWRMIYELESGEAA
jgi:DNA-binding transcriptional regulator YiaG